MANTSNRKIDILFGVKGGASLGGESGKLILKQLQDIADAINNSESRPKIVVQLDTEQTQSTIQKQLNEIGKGLTLPVKQSTSDKRGGKSWKDRLESDLYQAQAIFEKAQRMISKGFFNITGKEDNHTYQAKLDEVERVRDDVDKLLKQSKTSNFDKADLDNLNKKVKYLNKILSIQRQVFSEEQKQANYNQSHVARAYAKLAEDYEKYKSLIQSDPELLEKYNTLKANLSGDTYTQKADGISQMNKDMADFHKRCIDADVGANKFGRTIKKLFTEHFNTAIAMAGVAALKKALQQMIANVIELDKAVTDLQIATGKTRDETWELIDTYGDLAQQLGATITDVASAADTWLRQGYSIAEANELITQSMYLSKLGQIDSAAASTALTSAMKGYKMEVEDAASIVDKLTAVDMEAAASAGGLATAMAETANSARLSGITMDQLIGQIAVVKEVTQDGDEAVGTFFKTMYARMGNIKVGRLEDPETGESLSDVESTLAGVGISLRDSNSQFRNFGDVLDEVATKWDSYSNVQQRAIARAFGNTRQQEKFLVLMENYDDVLEYTEVAANSAGTAAQKYQDAYLSSIEAAKQKFMAAFQDLSTNIINSEIVSDIISFGTTIVNFIEFFTRLLVWGDGIVLKIGTFIGAMALLNVALKHVGISAWSDVSALGALIKEWVLSIPIVKSATAAYVAAGGGIAGVGAVARAACTSLVAMGTAFMATPLGVISAIVALLGVVSAFTDSWQANSDKLKQNISDLQEEQSSLQDEITTVKELQEELNQAGTDRAALAEIYDELNKRISVGTDLLAGEETAYRNATVELKGYLKAKEDEAKQKHADEQQKKKELADSTGYKKELLGIDGLAPDVHAGLIRTLLKIISGIDNDVIKAVIAHFFKLNPEEIEEWIKTDADLMVDAFADEIASYSGAGGSDFLTKAIESWVSQGYDSKQIAEAIKALESDSTFANLYKEFQAAVKTGSGGIFPGPDITLGKYLSDNYGIQTDSDAFNWLITLANNIAEASEEATVAEQSFADLYNTIKDGASAIQKAQQDMDKYGRLSAESIVAMEEAGLIDYLNKTENGYELCENALEKLVNTQNSSAVNAAKALIGWNDSLAKSYGDTVEGVLAATEAQKEAAKLAYMAQYAKSTWIGQGIKAKEWDKAYGKQYDIAIKNLKKQMALTDSVLQDSAAEKSASSWKTALDEKKHLLETGKITEQEYYDWVINNYQRMLGSYKENLDERQSVEEDYFKWLKDQYKDDLNEQKDNLNKQKDALKDFYDRRKQMVEDAYDEDEESRKRDEYLQEISKLERRVFALQADTSQSGQRALLEAQNELDEKRKEYEDWERGNAKDALLDMYDKQYEQEEKSIDAQVDAIENRVKNLDSNTSKIFDLIKGWAEYRGYKVPFNAAGTSNSPGGLAVTQERGAELIGMNVAGAFTYLTPNSKVWNASATDFLYKFANAPSAYLAKMMQNISASVPNVQANTISFGDIVVNGNADSSTVSALRKERENIAKEVLTQFKKLQRT